MTEQATANGRCVTTVDSGTVTTEVLERRPEAGRSYCGDKVEYLVHKVFQPSYSTDRDDYMRMQDMHNYKLTARQRQEGIKMEEPYEVHEWVEEKTLQLWQIRSFHERIQSNSHTEKNSPKHKSTNPVGSATRIDRQKIQVVKNKDGISEVRGLKAGQQLVEGPDGRFKLVTQHRPELYAPAYEPGMTASRTSRICFEGNSYHGRDINSYESNHSSSRHVRNANKLLRDMEDFEMSPQNKLIQLAVKQYTRNQDDPDVKQRLFQYFKTDPDTVKFFMHQYELSMLHGERMDNDMLYDPTMTKLESSILSSPGDLEGHQLRQTCCNVMKMMLEKVERHEKNTRRRVTQAESSTVRQRKIINQRIMSQLHKQKESLKRSIIRKRTMTEQSIRREVKVEVQQAVDSTQPVAPKAKQERKEIRSERSSSSRRNTSPMAVESSKKVQGDVYCVCQTPYDNTKFYIGCDKCKNWFHGACVNLTEDEAEKIESYICDECNGRAPRLPPVPVAKRVRRPSKPVVEEEPGESFRNISKKRRARENRLYCMCRKPFDYRDYIACETCEEWFHFECVGISKGEATMLKLYNCVPCRAKLGNESGIPHRTVFSSEHNLMLATFVDEIKLHKMSWPFSEPVSKAEFSDYYDIITEPIDLSVIEERANNCHYRYIDEFTGNLNLLFVNCRTYHQPNSVFYRCAENLESFVFNKLKSLVKKLFRI